MGEHMFVSEAASILHADPDAFYASVGSATTRACGVGR